MSTVFRLPDLGEGLHEAEIVSWHVAIGDHVVADQPLVSVETDKAIVEVPSPHAGHIVALHGQAGDIVQTGAPLVEFDEGVAEDKGAIVGDIPRQAEPAHTDTTRARGTSRQAGGAQQEAVRASPAVRRLAAMRGLDLAAIAGTGVDGTITRADVEDAAGSAQGAGEKLSGVRRSMYRNMTRAGREVVPATLTEEADIDCWASSTDPTVRLIRAVVAGCRAAPSVNAWFDAGTQTRRLHERVDLGLAAETEDGLFAPVLRDAGSLDAERLRSRLDEIKAGLAARSLSPADLSGQTITLSNFGMFGGRHAALVVVPPQVAILGAGRARPAVVAVEGRAAVRKLLPLSLTFDHRVVTGVEATRFLNAVIDDLEREA